MSRDALVVGINAYQHLPGLQAPARDAEAIAHQLQTSGEFRVHRLPEVIQEGQPKVGAKTAVTLRELETALVNLFKPKGSNIPHTALFYFSGHGIQKEAGIQEGYLAVSDSRPDVGFYGLSLFWLRRLLQESPVRQRILWLDCCHSGELLNFLEADPGARAGTDRLFMAASREYEAAYESLDGPYSVFTQALLDGLNPQREASGIITNHSLTAWVSQCLNGEVQQPLFENSGSEIILTRRVGPATQIAEHPSSEICPYRGLEFFDEIHADYFFGREELTDQLIEKLRTGRFIAVAGASGSGKSSLVRAGLMAKLHRGQAFSGSDRWRIKLLTPTEHPLKSLAAAFIDTDLTEFERAEQLRRAEIFLKDGSNGLAQLIRASLPIEAGTTVMPQARPHLLLIIDQFEEVFTLCDGPNAEQERQQFFNCLIGALRTAGECLSIIILLRADFIGKCSLYETLAQQIEQNLVMVTPLNYEQIKATITRPAKKVGLVCEPNLVYTMLLDLIGSPGELPLLQYTLMELWQRRQQNSNNGPSRLTLDTYTELGGVRGTLQKRATEIFYSLPPDEQAVAKRIFLALTQLGEGTEDTRRRVTKAELVSPAFPAELVERTLEKLVAAKLVITNREKNACISVEADSTKTILVSHETIDVAHEALIRNWSLLRGWLDENRTMLQRQRWIERAAQEWEIVGKPIAIEYLLRGSRLVDAEEFVNTYPDEISALAQQYVSTSQTERQRTKRESRSLQIAVPSILLVALAITVNQYRSTLQTQAEKDYQLQIATSRERAAIAQSILQEPNADPMTALLISRLSAEQSGPTFEAQSSLRAALRSLGLQLELKGHEGAVRQIVFSHDQRYVATSSADGTIRLWPLMAQTIYTRPLTPSHVLSWNADAPSNPSETPADITTLALSPDGRQVAAIAQGSPAVKVWSAATGQFLFKLALLNPANQIAFSPNNRWIATLSGNQIITLWQASTGERRIILPAQGWINSLQFSPDGQFLLTAGRDGNARLWKIATGETLVQPTLVKSLSHPAALNSACFSPTGSWIATAAADGKARLWNAATGTLTKVFPRDPSQPEFPNLSRLIANPTTLFGNQNVLPIQQVAFSPNGLFLAMTNAENQVGLWDIRTGQSVIRTPAFFNQSEFEPPASENTASLNVEPSLRPIAFSANSQMMATISRRSASQQNLYTVHLWNLYSGQEMGTLQDYSGEIEALQFSPDGTYIATSSPSGIVRLWSADRGGELPSIAIANAPAEWAAFSSTTSSSQNTRMVTVDGHGILRTWQIWSEAAPAVDTEESSPATPLLHPNRIESLNFWQWLLSLAYHASKNLHSGYNTPPADQADSADVNESVAAASPASKPVSTDVLNRQAIALNQTALTSFASSPNGSLVAIATADGWIELSQEQPDHSLKRLHRWQNFKMASQPSAATSTPSTRRTVSLVQQLTFSPDGKRLMGISDDLTIRLWNVQTGQLLHLLQGHQAAIADAQFSADGQRIVTASWDKTARIWKTDSGQLIRVFPHPERVNSARFSPDGTHIATASWDDNARILNADTGLEQVILTGHRDAVLSAEFSPDGRSLVTASEDGTARLWDAQTGIEQAQLRPNTAGEAPIPIQRAFFSPDGEYIATLAQDGQIHLWAATWQMLLKLARDRSLRQLTPEECIRYLRLIPNRCPALDLGSSS
ncbi:MAG TPA: caspase family protein [Crinalium sp.]